jgi:hypothetical protein
VQCGNKRATPCLCKQVLPSAIGARRAIPLFLQECVPALPPACDGNNCCKVMASYYTCSFKDK